MRFDLHPINDGVGVLERDKPDVWKELLDVISSSVYQVQECGEAKRVGEPIFSPSMNNAILCRKFEACHWLSGIPLLDPTPAAGKDVDFYKGGVVLEVQFSHYGLLQGDVARMQGLYSGVLSLRDGLRVDCGVVVVVNRAMPTSQSVARADQAVKRAAPLATSVPLAIVDVLVPEPEEIVAFHENVVPRARRPGVERQASWASLRENWRRR